MLLFFSDLNSGEYSIQRLPVSSASPPADCMAGCGLVQSRYRQTWLDWDTRGGIAPSTRRSSPDRGNKITHICNPLLHIALLLSQTSNFKTFFYWYFYGCESTRIFYFLTFCVLCFMDGVLSRSFFRTNAHLRGQSCAAWSMERVTEGGYFTLERHFFKRKWPLKKWKHLMNFPHLFENDFYAILPELYLTLSTLVLLLFGVFYSTSKSE